MEGSSRTLRSAQSPHPQGAASPPLAPLLLRHTHVVGCVSRAQSAIDGTPTAPAAIALKEELDALADSHDLMINFKMFVELCGHHPLVLFEPFKAQRGMRRKAIGPGFWTEQVGDDRETTNGATDAARRHSVVRTTRRVSTT